MTDAVQYKRHRVLEQLLEGGTRADARVEAGMLRTAIQNRDAESIHILLRYGANANGSDHQGYTPLFAATQGPFFEGAEMLVKAGANPNKSSAPEFEKIGRAHV